jgi:PIF1 helicase.
MEIIDPRQNILLPRIELCPPDPTIPFGLCRRRFLIKIAFAMTISKLQGQMLKRVEMYQPSPVLPMGNST